ncbi:hypothetical protein LUZ63_013474 [Rhynchospora breviuscula]|uniref:DUF3741 domain-containing protein n=1 Tax=Rhynchospora breviuscula TaxID=2022672 RepID=A0A9Q0C8L9_9POAL|nr:hypothetical protein LUZ63_013474 [Rhynchospora breviuscula]
MKDTSLFLFKNFLSSKMRKGIQNFCHGSNSTSTLNQRNFDQTMSCMANASGLGSSPLTLEQMILQLDLEEEAARRAKLNEYQSINVHRRMSCVNNSDILRSARDALNQYPRFSLDGKDAMYRSSFKPVCCTRACRDSNYEHAGYKVDMERTLKMPKNLAGESVIWCKPGIVAKLMGLEVLPVPVTGKNGKHRRNNVNPLISRKQNLRRLARRELEKERLLLAMHGSKGKVIRDGSGSSSLSGLAPNAACFERKSVDLMEPVMTAEDWRYRRTR